jgi:hypothetical protein
MAVPQFPEGQDLAGRAAVASWGQLWGHVAGRDLQLIFNINHLQALFGSRLAYHFQVPRT